MEGDLRKTTPCIDCSSGRIGTREVPYLALIALAFSIVLSNREGHVNRGASTSAIAAVVEYERLHGLLSFQIIQPYDSTG